MRAAVEGLRSAQFLDVVAGEVGSGFKGEERGEEGGVVAAVAVWKIWKAWSSGAVGQRGWEGGCWRLAMVRRFGCGLF